MLFLSWTNRFKAVCLSRLGYIFVTGFILIGLSACQPNQDQSNVPEKTTISVTDSEGNLVKLTRPAQRIVTLVPHTAELVYSAGAIERLVGISDRTVLPVPTNAVSVGAYNQTNIESILATHPDLVIAWTNGSDPKQLQKLKEAKIAVYVSSSADLEAVAKEVVDIGTLTNTQNIAKKNADEFLVELDKIKKQYRNKEWVDVFIQLGDNPIYTLSDNSFLGKMLHYCHARNIFGSATQPSLKVNPEQVIQANPEIIISLGEEKALKIWDKWPIRAKQNNRLYSLPLEQIGRPSLIILPELKEFCEKIDQARP